MITTTMMPTTTTIPQQEEIENHRAREITMATKDKSNHLKYITRVTKNYRPYMFDKIGQLNEVLAERTLVNLSDHQLSLTQIEALSAGLGFVPTLLPDPRKEQEAHTACVDNLVKNINTSLHFNSTAAQSRPTARGHLRKWMESRWKPTNQLWQLNPEIDPLLMELRCPPTAKNCKDDRPMRRDLYTAQQNGNPHTLRRDRKKNAPRLTHPTLIQALRQLKENPDIHIMKADKGGAIVIQRTVDYDREAMRQLSDPTTYQPLTYEEYRTQLKETHIQIVDACEVLHRYGHIKTAELNAIKEAPNNGSTAYFLAKIHKPENEESRTCPGRPIMAAHSCVARHADKLLTEWTGPLLRLIDGSLTDTTDLLNRLPKEPLPPTATVTTADVDSLYPNIPHERGIAASIRFYREHLDELREHCRANNLLPPPPTAQFGRLLEVVMSNSLIHFKNRFWVRQLKGTAMGMCISVYFANCYMWDVTRRIRENPPEGTVTFLRYIDDIIVIQADGNRATVEAIFNSITDEHTRYTIDPPAREGNFLDVNIHFSPEGRLETKPYSKATATITFLHYKSNHPIACKDSIPYSQLIRLRRITSRTENFIIAADKILAALRHRGYPRELLQKYKKQVLEMTQAELLAPIEERIRIQQERELKKHKERQRTAAKRKQVWKIPKRIQKILQQRASTTNQREEVPTATGETTDGSSGSNTNNSNDSSNHNNTTQRFITPYSATLDNERIISNLQQLREAIRTSYPYGDPNHQLMNNTEMTITHKRRQPTALLFTGAIKNPKMSVPKQPDERHHETEDDQN